MISGLYRHMSIQTVSRHLNIRWETVKNIDKQMLTQSLPSLNPATLKDLTLIGVDEVARAKGHDYMTVVYDMVSGQLFWGEHGRTADVLMTFLNQLPSRQPMVSRLSRWTWESVSKSSKDIVAQCRHC